MDGSYMLVPLSLHPSFSVKIHNINKAFFKDNEIILKKLGRISNFFDKESDKPSASLVIGGDIFKLYFEENVDLNLIKESSK